MEKVVPDSFKSASDKFISVQNLCIQSKIYNQIMQLKTYSNSHIHENNISYRDQISCS